MIFIKEIVNHRRGLMIVEELEEQIDIIDNNKKEIPFEEKFKSWDQSKVVRVKDPKANAYKPDKIFWENPKHHKSIEFYSTIEGFIKTSIRKYGCEDQWYDEDLPMQVYNKVVEAIDHYYDPYKANVITFLHKVLFNHIKLRAYHVNKYKDGTFYNKFFTYDKIVKSITRNLTMTDLITLDNYFSHLSFIRRDSNLESFLKDDLIKIAPKNNILFKAIIWELFQIGEDIEIGKHIRKFNNREDKQSIEERRSQIRRSYNMS